MYGIELAIIIFGTFSCALVSSSPSVSASGLLIFWRVLMVSTGLPGLHLQGSY